MIEFKEHVDRGYVELVIDGKVDAAGFEEVAAQLGPLMDEHGDLGLLKRVFSFRGMSAAALWKDLGFAFRHLKHVGPVAVVSDKKWIEVWTKLAAPLWMPKVKFFELDDVDDAHEWLEKRMEDRIAKRSPTTPSS